MLAHQKARWGRLSVIGLTVAVASTAAGWTAATATPAALVPSAVAPTANPDTPKSDCSLRLDSFSPMAAVTPDSRHTLILKASNNGEGVLTSPQLSVSVTRPLRSRGAVQDWLASAEGRSGQTAEIATEDLKAGLDNTITVDVDAALLDLDTTDEFGPRGIALDLAGEGFTCRTLLTVLVWMPDPTSVSPLRASVVTPITAGRAPNQAQGSPTELLRESTTEGGQLTRTLASLNYPEITHIVDPGVLAALDPELTDPEIPGKRADPVDLPQDPDIESAETQGDAAAQETNTPEATLPAGPTDDVEFRDQQAKTWVQAFTRSGHQNWMLPFADPDLASLTSQEGLPLLAQAMAESRRIAQRLSGTKWAMDESDSTDALDRTTDIASMLFWPELGTITSTQLEQLAPLKPSALLLSSQTVRGWQAGRTPSATGTLNSAPESTALVYDQTLTNYFATATDNGQDTGANTKGLLNLLADTAATSMESSSPERSIILTPGRDWDPRPNSMQRAMVALRSAPWLSLRSLQELSEDSPTHTIRLNTRAAPETLLHDLNQTNVLKKSLEISRFGRAFVTPDPVVVPLRQRLFWLLSRSWRYASTQELTQARQNTFETLARATSSPAVLPSDGVNLLTKQIRELPVYVSNRHPVPARVLLKAVPGAMGLQAQDVPIEVPANTRAQLVNIPIRSVHNGDVLLHVSVKTRDGESLSRPIQIPVRIRQDWELRGRWFAGVLFVLFLVGIARTIRRGPRDDHSPQGASPDSAAQESA